MIEFIVFTKYVGEGSQSSKDKSSDFYFGKNKDENTTVKIKGRNDSPQKGNKLTSKSKDTFLKNK